MDGLKAEHLLVANVNLYSVNTLMTSSWYWGIARTEDTHLGLYEGSVMNHVSVAVLSSSEFEKARREITDLSRHASYDDWLDQRYGRFMGLSLGGDDAQLVMIQLGAFLSWCIARGIRASEAALDAYAFDARRLQAGVGRTGAVQGELEASAPKPVNRSARPGGERGSGTRSRAPNSATRSAAVDW
jgi:hypothetical protein